MRMKPHLMFAIALIILSGTALAQEPAPKAEIFGGYAYMRTAAGNNVNGWNAQGTFYANKWFGITADFAAHYQSQPATISNATSKIYSILGGPQFVGRAGRVSGFAHMLIGVARG